MKKILALLLALCMVLALAACGGSGSDTPSAPADDAADAGTPAADAPEAAAVDMKVAMITDYGDITDQSFNQTTYEACKAWAEANGVDFKYYKPTGNSTAERVASIEQSINDGYNVIVMPGYAFGGAVAEVTGQYDDVKFVALDVAAGDILEGALGSEYDYNPDNWNVADYYNTANTYCAIYQEELCGYMAGYAAVKLGYRHLGFLGGMAVPAVMRYGYGYVQGVDAAAKELGLSDVTLNYAYGNQFSGDADITAAMDVWYGGDTEVVFACGGGIYTSAAEAAQKTGKKVIGVDIDQVGIIDGAYGEGMTVTSAMKGLANTVHLLLDAIKGGNWGDYVGKIDTLGLVSATPADNYVQLGTTQWSDDFTEADYEALVAGMYDGSIKVSNDISVTASDYATVISVSDQGNIK